MRSFRSPSWTSWTGAARPAPKVRGIILRRLRPMPFGLAVYGLHAHGETQSGGTEVRWYQPVS
jgi:hypothetical protein